MGIDQIVKLLREEIGESCAVVSSRDPFKVLISTVLSQRTRDENTAKASRQLFGKYKTSKQVSKASLKSIENLIKPSGFYKVKAKRVKEISKILVEKFNGKTPRAFSDLMSLPGVGRKTANCVLVYAFQKPAIPVDTHVHRISNRLGLVKTKTPEQSETELTKVVPKKYWIELNELMVKFGQRVCLPRYPKCGVCSLNKYCEYYKNVFIVK